MRHLILTLLALFSNINVFANNQITPTSNWTDKIKLSGLIMGELIVSDDNAGNSERFSAGKKKAYSTFCFPRASLYIDAEVNPLTKAHIGLNFAPDKMNSSCAACGFGTKNDEMRLNKYGHVDESYITFSDNVEPNYYIKAGIQYLPYGNYARNIIPATITQLLTQTQGAGITAGSISNNGLNIALFSFSAKKKRDRSTNIGNFGTQVQYITSTEEVANIFSLGWMNNIANSVNYLTSSNPTCCGKERNPLNNSYRKPVQAISSSFQHKGLYWDFTMQYTTTLSKFHPNDIIWKKEGAKPSAALIDAGYRFNAFGEKQNRVGASIQTSNQAVNIKGNNLRVGLPKFRIQSDYTIEIQKNVELGAHIFWDKDYSKNNSGTGKNSTTMLLTMAVKLG